MKTNKIIKNITDNDFLLGFLAGILVGMLIKSPKNGVIIGSYNGNCKNQVDGKKHKK